MKIAKLFKNGQSQAVRLPKEFRFDCESVFIKKTGNVVMLIPMANSWGSMLGSLDRFTPDFMSERNQPQDQVREEIFS